MNRLVLILISILSITFLRCTNTSSNSVENNNSNDSMAIDAALFYELTASDEQKKQHPTYADNFSFNDAPVEVSSSELFSSSANDASDATKINASIESTHYGQKKVILTQSLQYGNFAYKHSPDGCIKLTSEGAEVCEPPILNVTASTIYLMLGDTELLRIEGSENKEETSKMTTAEMLHSTSYTGRIYDGEQYDNIKYAFMKVINDNEVTQFLCIYYYNGELFKMVYED